jgi:hypothetical protein
MMGTFMLLFVFVVDTGMLVHAKINLQNAADLGAYAGAATQARQLTVISFLNYEMRRQFKLYLFKLYVLGNMALDSFPRSPSGSTSGMLYHGINFQGGQPTPGAERMVPATCVLVDPGSNYCRFDAQAGIDIPTVDPVAAVLDAVQGVFVSQLQSIEQIRQQKCLTNNLVNQMVHLLWLFNTDPSTGLNSLVSNSSIPQAAAYVTQLIAGYVASGGGELGLIPTEILLSTRITNVISVLNQPSLSTALQIGQANTLKSDSNPNPAYERTLQAFFSAYYSLGPSVFDPSSLQLTELTPFPVATNSFMQAITGQFDTYFVGVQLGTNPATATTASTTSTDCNTTLVPLPIQGVPLGFLKLPSFTVYYGVSLQAAANLLFWPFGAKPILKAYAVARPFGSRVGPVTAAPNGYGGATQFQYAFVAKPPASLLYSGGDSPMGTIPSLPLKSQEVLSSSAGSQDSNGFNATNVLSALYQGFLNGGGNGVNYSMPGASGVSLLTGLELAGLANPAEVGLYNIPDSDDFLQLAPLSFPTSQNGVGWRASIEAPLVLSNGTIGGNFGTLSDSIGNQVNNFFNENGGLSSGSTLSSQSTTPLINAMTTQLTNYVQNLAHPPGTVAEDVEHAIIGLPFQPLFSSVLQQIVTQNPLIFLSTQQKTLARTSWNTAFADSANNADFSDGRVGYSVKLVPFSSLGSSIQGVGDQNFKSDLQNLVH